MFLYVISIVKLEKYLTQFFLISSLSSKDVDVTNARICGLVYSFIMLICKSVFIVFTSLCTLTCYVQIVLLVLLDC